MGGNGYEGRTDESLIDEAKGIHAAMYQLDCFSNHDLLQYEFLCRELERRGYTLGTYTVLTVEKEEDEEEDEG